MPQNNKLNDFLDSLDDKNLQAFSERGPAGLDDEHLEKLNTFLSPAPVEDSVPHQIAKGISTLGNQGLSALDTGAKGMMDATVHMGKMAYSGYNQLADKFSDPSSPLYDEAVAGVLRALPGAVGVPESPAGVVLAGVGGAAEAGATEPLTNAIEGTGRAAAKKVFQLGGMPAVRAEGAAQNLEQIAHPENMNVLSQTYNSIMQKFGVQNLTEYLKSGGSKYAAATGDLAGAINEYTGKRAEQLLGQSLTGSQSELQELHNIVDATSKKLDAPWAYPGPENARANPKALMIDLYQMKHDALEKMNEWGEVRVNALQNALSPENLSKLSPEVAQTMKESAPRLLADARADTEALNQIGNIRKQMFLSKTSSKMNSLTPQNLNGSVNQLGALSQLWGLAAGGAGDVVAAAKSPIVGKGVVLGVRGAYNSIPNADEFSQFFNASKAPEDK